jgi:hypothetical protein
MQTPDIDAIQYRRNVDIEFQNSDIVIYRYLRFLDIDKCSFNICIRYRSFCASISNFVFFHIGVFVGSSLGCLLGTGQRLQCAHCIVNQSSPVGHAPPGPPSAAAAEAALGGAATPAAPAAAPAAATGAALGPEFTGAKFAAAGAADAAAGAGIDGTQERVILRDTN